MDSPMLLDTTEELLEGAASQGLKLGKWPEPLKTSQVPSSGRCGPEKPLMRMKLIRPSKAKGCGGAPGMEGAAGKE